jgi:hypothetical protein
LLSRDEDQALATHTKGGRKRSYFHKETHKESHPQNKFIPSKEIPEFSERSKKRKRFIILPMLPL